MRAPVVAPSSARRRPASTSSRLTATSPATRRVSRRPMRAGQAAARAAWNSPRAPRSQASTASALARPLASSASR
jgi:hypothetical protein